MERRPGFIPHVRQNKHPLPMLSCSAYLIKIGSAQVLRQQQGTPVDVIESR
jgi:hypothetical protein